MAKEKQKIPSGYKQTEIGVIPEDWDVGSLGELTTKIGSGITPTGGEKVYKLDGRPFLRSQNVGWGDLKLNDLVFIDEKTHSCFDSTEIEKDDVFLNITGASIGRSAIADKRVEKGNVNQHVCIIRTDKKLLNPKFLNLFLLSPLGQRFIASFQAGGNRQGLNYEQIKSIQITKPPIEEQNLIEKTISDIDFLIAKLVVLIQKKKLIKQGAMQELLTGKRRLPGFSGKWETKKLGDIADVIGGGTPSTIIAKYWNGSINWFTPTEIGFEKYACQSKRKITDEGLKNSSAKILNEGTILLTSRAGIGDLAILKSKACTNQGFQSLAPKNVTDSEFLYYLMLTKKNDLLDKASGSTFLEISPNNVLSILVQFPKISEQTAIANILSDMDAEIEKLESQLAKYQSIKQGMMQTLLTGRIRLV